MAVVSALIGFGLVGLGLLVTAPYAAYAVALVVVGTGCPPRMTAALPDGQAGLAGGLQSTTRELGSALGVAVVGTVTTSAFADAFAGAPHTVAAAFAVVPARQRVDGLPRGEHHGVGERRDHHSGRECW